MPRLGSFPGCSLPVSSLGIKIPVRHSQVARGRKTSYASQLAFTVLLDLSSPWPALSKLGQAQSMYLWHFYQPVQREASGYNSSGTFMYHSSLPKILERHQCIPCSHSSVFKKLFDARPTPRSGPQFPCPESEKNGHELSCSAHSPAASPLPRRRADLTSLLSIRLPALAWLSPALFSPSNHSTCAPG